MRFVLPTDTIDKLKLLRDQYQQERQVNIEAKPSMIGLPTLFGGTDVTTRKKQIIFLEKILTVLSLNLKNLEEINTPEELQANITAWRLYLTACWYVQSQNSKNSALSRVINNDLGITAENFPDEEDKEICYATARRLINTKNALEDSNAALIKAGLKPLSETDWSQFSKFINDANEKKVSTSPYTDYPITSITQPLFGAAFTYTGATIGLLSGDVISRSTKVMSSKFQLTAFIGSSLLILGPAGPAGVALFAPVIANQLITSFCSITLGHILAVSMGLLGKGVGTLVGLPLDLAYRLLWQACSLVGGYCSTDPKNPIITGMRIGDGMTIISGIAIDVTPVDRLPEGYIKQIIEIKDDGLMYVDGKAIVVPSSGIQLPPEMVAELKIHLKVLSEKSLPEAIEEATTSSII